MDGTYDRFSVDLTNPLNDLEFQAEIDGLVAQAESERPKRFAYHLRRAK